MEQFHYLDNSRISECLVQDVHLVAELQGVDDEVLLSGRDLHQRSEAEETPVGMVLGWRRDCYQNFCFCLHTRTCMLHNNHRNESIPS